MFNHNSNIYRDEIFENLNDTKQTNGDENLANEIQSEKVTLQ